MNPVRDFWVTQGNPKTDNMGYKFMNIKLLTVKFLMG